MLNLNVAVSVKDAGLPFICVIKGSKRRQHRLLDNYVEYLFVYDTEFRSIGKVELKNVFPEKLEDIEFKGRFNRKLKEDLFAWFKEKSEFSRLKINNYDLARNCSKFLHYTDEDSSEVIGKSEMQKISYMFVRGSIWLD